MQFVVNGKMYLLVILGVTVLLPAGLALASLVFGLRRIGRALELRRLMALTGAPDASLPRAGPVVVRGRTRRHERVLASPMDYGVTCLGSVFTNSAGRSLGSTSVPFFVDGAAGSVLVDADAGGLRLVKRAAGPRDLVLDEGEEVFLIGDVASEPLPAAQQDGYRQTALGPVVRGEYGRPAIVTTTDRVLLAALALRQLAVGIVLLVLAAAGGVFGAIMFVSIDVQEVPITRPELQHVYDVTPRDPAPPEPSSPDPAPREPSSPDPSPYDPAPAKQR